jgi:hypothetical protein
MTVRVRGSGLDLTGGDAPEARLSRIRPPNDTPRPEVATPWDTTLPGTSFVSLVAITVYALKPFYGPTPRRGRERLGHLLSEALIVRFEGFCLSIR